MKRSSHEPDGSPDLPGWSGARKCLVSGLLAVHLTAVFVWPFQFATRGANGASPAADVVARPLRHYIDFAYLNHGYFFFAPNPGPSHVVRYQLEFADGRDTEVGWFPDLQQHHPRLLYHRYFMLSEWLNTQFAPPQPPPEFERGTREYEMWDRSRRGYELFRQSYVEHLQAATGARRVTLTRREHRQPTRLEFGQRGLLLGHPSLYEDLPEELPSEPETLRAPRR